MQASPRGEKNTQHVKRDENRQEAEREVRRGRKYNQALSLNKDFRVQKGQRGETALQWPFQRHIMLISSSVFLIWESLRVNSAHYSSLMGSCSVQSEGGIMTLVSLNTTFF